MYLHWGVELVGCPTDDQRSLARALTRAGADIVVGGHAHRLLGGGKMGKAFVDYGLGNFVWYGTSELSTQTGVLFVTATGRRIDSYRWAPARIVDGVPRPLSGSERARELASGAPSAAAPAWGDSREGRATLPCPGPLAQLVEQGTLNPKVEGSNPSRPKAL